MPCDSLSAGTAPQHYTRPCLHTNTAHCPSVFTRLAVMPHSLLTQSGKTPTDHEEQPVPQQFLRQLIHSTLNSSGTRRTRDGRLATGNPHRQPPATYGAHQSRNSSTPPSKRTKQHDQPAPSTQPLMMNYLIRSRASNACYPSCTWFPGSPQRHQPED